MNLQVLKAAVTSRTAMHILKLKKHAPVILFAAGVTGVVGTVVLACRATMKLEAVLDGLQEDLDHIDQGTGQLQIGGQEIEPARAKTLLYAKASYNIGKLYAPAVVLGAASIAALTGSHVILTQRNTALMAVAAATQRALDKYRSNVRAELGEDQDKRFLYGETEREIVEETAEGPITKTVKEPNGAELRLYDKFFDELNENYVRGIDGAEKNVYFIRCAQNWANDKLKANGHLFLNDVYGMLGIPLTQAGQQVGWVMGEGRQNFVDFGIFDHRNAAARRFINGYEPAVRLHFNVDGVILDLIGKKR